MTHSMENIAQTLVATDYKDPQIIYRGGNMEQKSKYKVRRLTPTECERLQGYPDGWTKDIEIKYPTHTEKQIISNSARYKALGNSVAVPCVQFVISGIARELKKEVEEDERG